MKAAYYRCYGAARDVFERGELPDPEPGPGEVRVKIGYSGVNPSDCNRRSRTRDRPGYPLIIPHSDGAGEIDKVGAGVDKARRRRAMSPWQKTPCRPRGGEGRGAGPLHNTGTVGKLGAENFPPERKVSGEPGWIAF